jgi:hypothetical protein
MEGIFAYGLEPSVSLYHRVFLHGKDINIYTLRFKDEDAGFPS